MAKVSFEIGKAKVIIPEAEVEINVEGIKINAEYNAEELTIGKELLQSAMGYSNSDDSAVRVEIEGLKAIQVSTNNLLKDMIGTFMNLFNTQNDLNEKNAGVIEKITSILGKAFGVKPEPEAVSSEELEDRKQRVEFYKSGV